jgi:hypothetical protein
MLSLAAALKKKPVGEGGKGKKAKVTLLDLNHNGNDDDGDDDEGGSESLMGKEQEYFETLRKKHSNCQLCGPLKACKIGANGTHIPRTHAQLQGWALSLVGH